MSLPASPDTPARPEETDLFDRGASDWIVSPEAAFDAWLAMQDYRRSSADVYRAQWGAFLMDARAPEESGNGRYRNHREFRRRTADPENPANALFAADRARARPHPAYRIRIDQPGPVHCSGWRSELAQGARQRTDRFPHAGRARDVALVPVLADRRIRFRVLERAARPRTRCRSGAGIKTGEARALTISCINTSGTSLRIESTHPDFARGNPPGIVRDRAAGSLAHRAQAPGDSGELVFPASHAGRPMHKATMLRAIDAIVESAGSRRRAPRAQPKRCAIPAAELFEHDVPPERVGKWLGFMRPISSTRSSNPPASRRRAPRARARKRCAIPCG